MTNQSALAKMEPNDQIKTLGKFVPEGEVSPQTYLDLVKTQIMGVDSKGNARPIEDLAFFLRTAHKAGLDPIARQIHVVYRYDSKLGREKMAIQTGIDGLRLVAQRSGDYAGQDDVVYDSEDVKQPKWAKVTVYRFNKLMGERVAYTATARWNEYVATGKDGKPMVMWEKMPFLMLGKVAEALALRKAFPQELSGLYSEDEMSQERGNRFTADLPKPERAEKKESVKTGGQVDITPKSPVKTAVEVKVEEPKTEEPVIREAEVETVPSSDGIPVINPKKSVAERAAEALKDQA